MLMAIYDAETEAIAAARSGAIVSRVWNQPKLCLNAANREDFSLTACTCVQPDHGRLFSAMNDPAGVNPLHVRHYMPDPTPCNYQMLAWTEAQPTPWRLQPGRTCFS